MNNIIQFQKAEPITRYRPYSLSKTQGRIHTQYCRLFYITERAAGNSKRTRWFEK